MHVVCEINRCGRNPLGHSTAFDSLGFGRMRTIGLVSAPALSFKRHEKALPASNYHLGLWEKQLSR